jgi:hypothetical protein
VISVGNTTFGSGGSGAQSNQVPKKKNARGARFQGQQPPGAPQTVMISTNANGQQNNQQMQQVVYLNCLTANYNRILDLI